MYKEMLKDVRAVTEDPTALPNIGLYLMTFTKAEKNAAAVEMGYKNWAEATKRK